MLMRDVIPQVLNHATAMPEPGSLAIGSASAVAMLAVCTRRRRRMRATGGSIETPVQQICTGVRKRPPVAPD